MMRADYMGVLAQRELQQELATELGVRRFTYREVCAMERAGIITRTTEPLTGRVAPRRFPAVRQQWLPETILDLLK